MSAATQVYYASFDTVFSNLSPALQTRIEEKIDLVGGRLDSFPHHRLKASNRFRLRVGDYRVVYTFDVTHQTIHLLALGNRREIYRQ
jgi:mRNA-degrading endonuclease RelE of RelBE toxin-antitoxin system